MKKLLSAILACVLIACALFALSACGDGDKKLSGTYEGHEITLKFSGDSVTVGYTDMKIRYQVVGEYDIEEKNGKYAIDFSFKDMEDATDKEKVVLTKLASFGNTFDDSEKLFEDNGSSIKIGLLTFNKE